MSTVPRPSGGPLLIQDGQTARTRGSSQPVPPGQPPLHAEPLPPGRIHGDASRAFGPVSHRRHLVFATGTLVVDLLASSLGLLLPAILRLEPLGTGAPGDLAAGIALVALSSFSCIAILSARGAYAPRCLVSISDQLMRVASAVVPAWVLTQMLAFWLKVGTPFDSRLVMGLSLPAGLLLVASARLFLVRPAARRTYRRFANGPVLVLGDTAHARRIAEDHERLDARRRRVTLRPLSEVGPEDAAGLVSAEGFGEVLIEPEGRPLEEVLDVAFACLDAQADVHVVSRDFEVVAERSEVLDFSDVPVLHFRRIDLSGPEAGLKRLIDLLGSAAGLLVLSPILLVIAIAVKTSSKGPVLFEQERVGRGGRPFRMYKFRTMRDGNDPRGHREYLRSFIQEGSAAGVGADGAKIYKLADDPRVTPVGGWLRKLSLDELPQLWNVLRGEMSLVGPRPCLPYEWEMYRPWQRRRLDVLPGCTGLWQVTARSRVSFDEMVILDLHYAHHGTPLRDLLLIAQTVPAMLRGRGGY